MYSFFVNFRVLYTIPNTTDPTDIPSVRYLRESKQFLYFLLWFCLRSISITGYMPFEVLGTSVYDYIHEDDLTVYAKAHEARKGNKV